MDNITCPNCGEEAFSEQDTDTLETHIWCNECGYDSNDDSNDNSNEVRDPKKVYIVWCWDDVQTLRPDWSEEQCQTALDSIRKGLQDRSVELGWDIMDILLDDSEACDGN